MWPLMFRTSSSHEEGGVREFATLTRRFLGSGGRVAELETVGVRFQGSDASGRPRMEEIPGTERRMPADLVLLAMGFVSPIHAGLLGELGVRQDARGNVAADLRGFATSEPGVFAAGDCRRGQSLVVWALWEGREAARAVDQYLCGASWLQSRNAHV
jgi:glutamate synthase (NADPH/NADH) small chain